MWRSSAHQRLRSVREFGHPSKFQRFSCLGYVTAAKSLTGGQSNFAGCLAVSWAATLNIHFQGLLSPNGILPGAKCTLRPILAFSYIGSVAAQHSSIGRQPNFAAWYKEWNYTTFAEGAIYMYIRQGGRHNSSYNRAGHYIFAVWFLSLWSP